MARDCLTLVVWFQLGEFRRFSVGEISESGRGIALGAFAGEGMVLLFERRRGCTWRRHVRIDYRQWRSGGQVAIATTYWFLRCHAQKGSAVRRVLFVCFLWLALCCKCRDVARKGWNWQQCRTRQNARPLFARSQNQPIATARRDASRCEGMRKKEGKEGRDTEGESGRGIKNGIAIAKKCCPQPRNR